VHLPKIKMKTFRKVSQRSVHILLYYKIIFETWIGPLLCNSFNFKTYNGITIKLTVNPLITIHSINRCTTVKPTRKLRLTRARSANFVTMIANRVNNLSGKSLSKLIQCFVDTLTKMLCFFNKHAVISKDTINANTWNH